MIIGIYAYARYVGDTFGGVESHAGTLTRELIARGHTVVFHSLASDTAGVHVQGGKFQVGSRLCARSEHLSEFCSTAGPGIAGAIDENVQASIAQGESLILCFGTRDGYVFQVAQAVAAARQVPLVCFVYFTKEERHMRAAFTSRTRSIPGLASDAERRELETRGVSTLRAVMEQAALVVVPTYYVRGQMSEIASGPTELARLFVCYHGVDTQVFAPPSTGQSRRRAWLHVSRLSVPFALHKGYLWSASFFAECADSFPEATLSFIGSGSAASLIKEFAAGHQLHARILTEGFMPQAQLAQRYKSAAVLLVPSMMEAGCTSIVEAVLSGCAPVVADAAGAGEVMAALGLEDCVIPTVTDDLGSGIVTQVPSRRLAHQVLERIAGPGVSGENRIDTAVMTKARELFSSSATTDRLLFRLSQMGLIQ